MANICFLPKKAVFDKTKMKAGETTYAIDTQIAGIMLIPRDVTVEDYSDLMTYQKL